MQIIEHGELVEDRWTRVADGDALPASGPVFVSLARWAAERETLRARSETGVWLEPDEEIDALTDDLDAIDAIAFHFPKFADGRPYSRARLLRDRHGYTKPIRAFGDVLRDQLHYMHRCGFTVFEVRPDRDPADALKGLDDFSVSLQPAVR